VVLVLPFLNELAWTSSTAKLLVDRDV
jgi:hypothetical protein